MRDQGNRSFFLFPGVFFARHASRDGRIWLCCGLSASRISVLRSSRGRYSLLLAVARRARYCSYMLLLIHSRSRCTPLPTRRRGRRYSARRGCRGSRLTLLTLLLTTAAGTVSPRNRRRPPLPTANGRIAIAVGQTSRRRLAVLSRCGCGSSSGTVGCGGSAGIDLRGLVYDCFRDVGDG